ASPALALACARVRSSSSNDTCFSYSLRSTASAMPESSPSSASHFASRSSRPRLNSPLRSAWSFPNSSRSPYASRTASRACADRRLLRRLLLSYAHSTTLLRALVQVALEALLVLRRASNRRHAHVIYEST